MIFAMPASRKQMWLARGAVIACIGLLVWLGTIGFGDVTSFRDGNATVYRPSLVESALFGAMGMLTCVGGVVFFMQPGRLYKLCGRDRHRSCFAMMKKALPDILQNAEVRGVKISENADGWRIPPELSG